MITVRIPRDKNFNYKECKTLYKKCRRLIGDNQEFREIVANTHFFSFYNDGDFLGCIYVYDKCGKLYLNAFASRHHHKENIESMKMVLSWYTCDIYAESTRKTAIYCLLELGFKKIGQNLYKYER